MQLSSDDFNYCSWNSAACFSFLGKQSSKFYSPSIESPLSYLRTRVWNGDVKTVNANDEFSVEAGETVFVHFNDGAAHPTQNDRLAAHDAAIERIVSRLGEKDIVYIYTAIENHETLKRVARQTTPVEQEPGYQFRGQKFVVRVLHLAKLEKDQVTNLTLSGDATFESTETTAKITLPGTPGLVFNVIQDGGSWWVETLDYDNNHYTSGTKIGANNGFSFSCTPEVVYVTPNSTDLRLMITGLQLEVNLDREAPADGRLMSFSEAWDCVGFTSAGIWGGLFVTLLLLFILTIGISWMLDINTMDRFDDPKGKTITINAQE